MSFPFSALVFPNRVSVGRLVGLDGPNRGKGKMKRTWKTQIVNRARDRYDQDTRHSPPREGAIEMGSERYRVAWTTVASSPGFAPGQLFPCEYYVPKGMPAFVFFCENTTDFRVRPYKEQPFEGYLVEIEFDEKKRWIGVLHFIPINQGS